MKTYEQGYKEGATDSITSLTKVLTDLALGDGRQGFTILEFQHIADSLISAINETDGEQKQ